MKVIKQNAQLLDTSNMTPYQVIERVGRTCYKSENNITEDSAAGFVSRLYRDGHHAMLEFGWVYVKIDPNIDDGIEEAKEIERILSMVAHCATQYIHFGMGHITGSLRAFHDWFHEMIDTYYDSAQSEACIPPEFISLMQMFIDEYPEIFGTLGQRINGNKAFFEDLPEKCPFKFVTKEVFLKGTEWNYVRHPFDIIYMLPHIVMFTTDRGVTHELCRHRPCSFAMESTRYCNYGKEKFGGELTVIEPCFANVGDIGSIRARNLIWELGMEEAERNYLRLLQFGATPEQARDALPHAVKADLWMCATEDEWQHILDLRYHENTGKAHPKMKALMEIAYPQLYKASEGRIR